MAKRLLLPPSNAPLPPARQDGRPLYYDIAPTDIVQCALCLQDGKLTQYKQNEAFLADPANSPLGPRDKGVYTICRGHIPDDAVIFNPHDQTCRNKEGADTWREGEWEDLRAEPDATRH